MGRTKWLGLLGLVGAAVALSGCTRDGKFQALSMWNESRLKPYEENPMRPGESSSRTPAPGSIARGELRRSDPIRTGREGGKLLTVSPVPVTQALLKRGQERFNIYCTPCHGKLGDGEGMLPKRGFPHPPDYAIKRLRDAPVGHFYDAITNGYGVMYSYAHSVQPHDRWAIAEYIRVLQASRPVVSEDKYLEERKKAREEGFRDPSRPMNVTPGH
jgi:mono/diheme cytochrome c family protein